MPDLEYFHGSDVFLTEALTIRAEQELELAAQQQNQGLSNIMGSMKQAAGGSGVAALAQSLANQQSQNAQAASASIGSQEASNQAAAARQGIIEYLII